MSLSYSVHVNTLTQSLCARWNWRQSDFEGTLQPEDQSENIQFTVQSLFQPAVTSYKAVPLYLFTLKCVFEVLPEKDH